MEVRETFRSLDGWLHYARSGKLISLDGIKDLGAQMTKAGAIEPLTNHVIPPQAWTIGHGWREGLAWGGVNSRTRAVMAVIQDILGENLDPRIYAAEGITGFALRLRGLYPRFIGSEYTDDPVRREQMFPVPFEDLHALSFGDNLFDIVSTNEVLEHIPSIDQALSELCRVLKPGGWHVGTHPFAMMQEDSVVRTMIENGKLVHVMEPEYHGNPMSEQGSLVFEIPAWDILKRARAAGFSDAFMRYVISKKHACLADQVGGIFVLCCQK